MLGKLSDLSLPDKLYFKIGETSKIIGVKPYVLRYWETEFKQVRPVRRKSQRLYDKDTIHLFLKIKHMLHNQKFTIEGVRKILNDERDGNENLLPLYSDKSLLREILNELKSLRQDL
ncbi:MAG: MerR family transcriptional regulator [Candidatus Dadabacteria bacterium]|nr:MerR family transcriptional regulator [Candidatus Dadabacteria bacterium]MCY4262412.1 MerR family transcriptional regulator [Candidatus Dadabacteria bacterium]